MEAARSTGYIKDLLKRGRDFFLIDKAASCKDRKENYITIFLTKKGIKSIMEYGIGIPGFFGFLASGLPTVKGKDRFSDLQSSLYFYKSMIIIIVLFFLSVLKLHKYRHIDSWM